MSDDVGGVRPEELAAFRAVGAHLARRGLVQGSEGNLSIFDGHRLVITRTGSRLGSLGEDDVLVGTLDEPPSGASSDLRLHLERYDAPNERDGPRGVRAVVHAHPAGSVPAGWVEGQAHGAYALGRTLEHAAATLEHALRSGQVASLGPSELAGEEIAPFSAVWFAGGPVPAARLPDGDPRDRGGLELATTMTTPSVAGFDQTRFPSAGGFEVETVEGVADAIRRLAVRGAPLLGISAAYGMVLAACRSVTMGEDVREATIKAGSLLVATRPTAVNIRWAVGRLEAAIADLADEDVPARLLAEARAIEAEDAAACSAMGWFGSELIPAGANVLTHCNTGMLCTAGIGTAFGVLWCSHLAGRGIHVWVDETRPLLQGARLTAWELQRLGVPFTMIADGAAGSLLARGLVDAVILGADRIAANGDVANKVGTYSLAVLAARHSVPFYVAAPTSTVDPATPSGDAIEIEERDPEEVTHAFGKRVAPEGAPALNPAFDVTPAELITAIVTERGVVRPPYAEGLAS
ncbi:MAG TPA: S-methyl-5-thioribose-1-phosphate isomerase [Actinomycetota bacterium]|nr:S-methyl-5-thioribose-1-phosphate isomerase [Actinomycetota bacterium]